jgi:hypothetical protein
MTVTTSGPAGRWRCLGDAGRSRVGTYGFLRMRMAWLWCRVLQRGYTALSLHRASRYWRLRLRLSIRHTGRIRYVYETAMG